MLQYFVSNTLLGMWLFIGEFLSIEHISTFLFTCSFSLLIRPTAAIVISSNVAYSYSCAEPNREPTSTPAEIAARLQREVERERVCKSLHSLCSYVIYYNIIYV